MPSPSRKYARRSSPSSSRRAAGGGAGPASGRRKSPPEHVVDDNNDGGASSRARGRGNQSSNPSMDPSRVGKRTGVILPPRGEIPLDDDGLEDADAFFAAAKSPNPSVLNSPGNHSHGSHHGSPGKAYGKRAEKFRERERREDEKRRRREELEEEGRRNLGRRPDGLNRNDDDDENESGDEGDGGGKPRDRKDYQPTPKQPGWSNRLMHKAMGVPTEDSPQYTVLSKVSTAAPSTHGSLDTIGTEARHGLRKKNAGAQLDRLAHKGDSSPEVGKDPAEGGSGRAGAGEEEAEFEGPMDPPEEMSQDSHGGEKRGVDPEERDDVLEPEGENENNDERGEEEGEDLDAKPSAKSMASAKSAASSKTDALENSLEEMVESNYNQDYDDDDDGGLGGGGMQFATQQDDDDAASFGGGNDGGFDDMDDNNDDDGGDLMGNDDDALSARASQKSRGSTASAASAKSAASGKSGKSKASSKVSEQQQPPTPDEEEEDESPPKKKKAKKAASKQPPVTPTSVLRTSKKSKKKKQNNNRVNFSTPTGTSTGIPAGNREYESVPVSDYKDEYAPGEEPKTPGGSTLRRSRRAKFKPLQFWKNEKLIYEAQNEKGMLGEAMGDMPVVAGVLHALPTPYKEVKRKAPERKKEAKKKGKRKRGDDSDEDSDDDETVAKAPFDDKSLRKRYRIKNGESGSVWSETLESATDIKIVSRIDNRTFSKLPLSSTRKKKESKVVGFASQAFHVPTDDDDLFPGYIAGNVVLPPRGIKDAEGVGLCSQVFNVGDCQPNSLEFALADPSGQDGEFDPKTAQRYLLSKGDMFQIPPGNVYRIENHSRTAKATLFWTIVKCTSRAEQEDDESDSD